ncbi:MAG TPA: hypothetical protein VJ300_06045 [Thermoplasmata archaeon]|nr:hypothetical protein [Thermoplasmata archaeon]
MDLMWLVIPAAIGLFLARTILIARRLKVAAANPTLADARALREAKRSLRAHRVELDSAVAGTHAHLESAKRLARTRAPRAPSSRVERMVEDAFSPKDS